MDYEQLTELIMKDLDESGDFKDPDDAEKYFEKNEIDLIAQYEEELE